jgi:predicted RNA-binding Zn-ribbon protein involved in translation (DUF1610 family)
MKTLILTITLIISSFATLEISAQSYTTESKSCGSCQKEVSINSRIGMKCPHCGVVWGQENTSRTTSTYPSSTNYNMPKFDNYNSVSFATTNSTCNLRSYQSTNAAILAKIPAFTTLDVIEIDGSWVKVKYTYYDIYAGSQTKYGYVYKSLLSFY